MRPYEMKPYEMRPTEMMPYAAFGNDMGRKITRRDDD
jgi:hypothetical protein